jgi:hypothetical protein
MTGDRAQRGGEVVTVVRPMNRYGTMTVEVPENNETRHVVDYAERELKSTLAALPEGTSVPIELRRLNCRSNAWEAVDFGASRSATATAATSD